MHEAEYYHIVRLSSDGEGSDEAVQCDLCPHGCKIREGHRGICGSRIALRTPEGQGDCQTGELKLYSEVYGHPCALAIDPVEKKPLLHFHRGTFCYSLSCTGCNFRCLNCQNYDISQAKPSDVETADMSPEDVVNECIAHKCPSIAYTYTEPLTYFEYIYDIAALARKRGLYNILVSAGYINPEPLKRLSPLLDAANIDLKSFSDEIYHHLNGGSLAPVLGTLKILLEAGTELEITNLLIPGYNDDPQMLKAMCKWLYDNGFKDCPLHFSRFFPRYRLSNLAPTPVATLYAARKIAEDAGIRYVHLGNV